jgi:serine/threonine protein kinase
MAKFGKYELLERLGYGGMAEIFKAKTYGEAGFEKIVAIKRILPHLGSNKEFIDMLVAEAKLSVQLTHANIVQVLDLGKLGGTFYIVMEYVEGMDLGTLTRWLLKAKRRVSPRNAFFIMAEVCKGLDYAHTKIDAAGKSLGIVHRDVSPPNIFISVSGEVKVGDFGIAKATNKVSHTEAGMLKGKLAYMSPEQARAENVDRRTDLFATGLMLYELLTGHQAYESFLKEHTVKVLNCIETFDFGTLADHPALPLPVIPILERALAPDPGNRYESARDFKKDLDEVLQLPEIKSAPEDYLPMIQVVYQHELKFRQKRAAEDKAYSMNSVKDVLPPSQHAPRFEQSLVADVDFQTSAFQGADFLLSPDGTVEKKPGEDELEILKPPPLKPPGFQKHSGLELANPTPKSMGRFGEIPIRPKKEEVAWEDLARQLLSGRNIRIFILILIGAFALTHLPEILLWINKGRLFLYQQYLSSQVPPQ